MDIQAVVRLLSLHSKIIHNNRIAMAAAFESAMQAHCRLYRIGLRQPLNHNS